MVATNQHWKICLYNPEIKFVQQPMEIFEEKLIKSDNEGHYLFKKDWRRDEKGKMYFINKDILAA